MKTKTLLACALLAAGISTTQAAVVTVNLTGSVQLIPDGPCDQHCANRLSGFANDTGLNLNGWNAITVSLDVELDSIPYNGSQEWSGFYGYAIQSAELTIGALSFNSYQQTPVPSGNFGWGNTLRLQAPPYVSRLGISLAQYQSGSNGINGVRMATTPVDSPSNATMAYEWRDFALDFHSAAFTSQDLNDLETLLGAANLFSSSTTNYFHAGIDFVNPDTVLWTDAYGWNFYSRYYPTLSLNGVLTGMSIQQPSAVPVPAAAWLLGSGLLGMVAIARRRRG